MNRDYITIVCGFPRSGTSLMMRMLETGGIEPFCDAEQNRYSYETHHTMRLPRENEFLLGCYGKAVKILDPQRHTPPPLHRYRFVWMKRNYREQAKSLVKFMHAAAPATQRLTPKLDRMADSLERDEKVMRPELKAMGDIIVVRFESLIKRPKHEAQRVASFLNMDGLAAEAMAKVVVKRSPKCYKGLLEAQLMKGGT